MACAEICMKKCVYIELKVSNNENVIPISSTKDFNWLEKMTRYPNNELL